MRILFLTHRMPYPPNKGERIRAFYELKHLAVRHQVDVFCLADSTEEIKHTEDLKQICNEVHVECPGRLGRTLRAFRSFVSGRPISFGYFESSELRQAVHQALSQRSYQLIFVNCSSMAQYVPQPAPAPVIVDFVDADSNKFVQYAAHTAPPQKWIHTLEAGRVAKAEREIGRLADLSLVVTASDAADLGGPGWTGSEIKVVGAGVEIPPVSSVIDSSVLRHQPFALFLGTMSYLPNADAVQYFAEEIYPIVRFLNPQLKFVIAGREPGKQVRNLAQIPGVVVTGAVSDAFQYFRAATISVAPFRISQGFQNKVAESLAVGTPVVATRRVASGVGLSEREGLFVAESAADFAHKVAAVAGDRPLLAKLRGSASEVRKQLSWELRLSNLDRCLEQVTAKNSAQGVLTSVVGH